MAGEDADRTGGTDEADRTGGTDEADRTGGTDEADRTGGTGGTDEADETDGDTHAVTLVRDDRSTSSVTVEPDETILEATDDTDLDLRYGCREGRCVSCTARLLDGDVVYLTDPAALDERQREEGFVLLCISRPVSDCRIAVGRSVLADAFPTLWRSGNETL